MSETLLEVSNLHAWYGESHILHGVDFTVNAGEMVCILGRNGVGKTTTMRSLIGILRKRNGTLRFAGRDLMATSLHRSARLGLGYVPEERGIFAGLTVQENLLLPPVVAPGGMSIDEIFALFPNLAERRKSMGMQLSGGEQQMLAMARILRTGARCILLDEPTEGLAPVIIDRIGEVLNTLKARGMTVVLVEQNFAFASKIADRFLLMDHGMIVGDFMSADIHNHMDQLHEVLGV